MSDAQSNFDRYQNEFDLAKSQVEDGLQQVEDSLGNDRRAAISRTREALREAESALDQMKFTKSSIPANAKQPANKAYEDRKNEYSSLVRTLEYREGKRPQNPDGPADGSTYDGQRSKMLSNSERLDNAGNMLSRSEQLANETLNVATSTLAETREQRERISGISNNLHSAENPLDRSLRNVRGMDRRRKTNKLIMYAIIAVLCLLIVFVIVSKFR